MSLAPGAAGSGSVMRDVTALAEDVLHTVTAPIEGEVKQLYKDAEDVVRIGSDAYNSFWDDDEEVFERSDVKRRPMPMSENKRPRKRQRLHSFEKSRPTTTSKKKMPRRQPARRKRLVGRGRKPKYTRRRISTGGMGRIVRSSALAQASAVGGSIKVVRKLLRGINPTAMESGGALTSFITNDNGKTTPNGNFAFSYEWTLENFPDYTLYTGAYQWYKILWVKVHFYPLQNSHPALRVSSATNPIIGYSNNEDPGTVASHAPQLIVAPDKQGAAIFSSESDALQHAGAIHHVFNNGNDLSIHVAPQPTGLLGTAGSEAIYEIKGNKWISTGVTNVPHYGVRCHMVMPSGPQIKVMMEMKVAFKHPKS